MITLTNELSNLKTPYLSCFHSHKDVNTLHDRLLTTPDSDTQDSRLNPSTLGVFTTPEPVSTDSQDDISGGDGRTQSVPPIPHEKFSFAKPVTIAIHRESFLVPARDSETSQAVKKVFSQWAKKTGKSYYRHLSISSRESRLLYLKPGAPDHDINVSFLTVDDLCLGTTSYPYAALSYHWGDGPDDRPIIVSDDPKSNPILSIADAVETMMIGGRLKEKRFFIRQNLYDALKNLRDETETLVLWVDALCINQSDEYEKKEQVLKMNRIYSNAYNVCVWLGCESPGDPISDVAMDFIGELIESYDHEALLNDDIHIEKWASLFELLKWS
ncbi:hypothetical protein N0V83_001911 [Neocucurbitaria cava]|uniref:Heterokaryon incompatibility domain-containing protein n=1 Tax=Neocucurbitaria cava TaxID=798079 RepID=A0A9W8YFA4_9PLEO|nr:hypothetical protein N0V83_001911 [Neocucurbitaria cava]